MSIARLCGPGGNMIPEIRNYTKAESETLAQVAAGTPMGDLLRRYWWPINISAELKEKPTFVRFFGENLVLFRDRTGHPGLIAANCAHRRANLCLGTTTAKGIRCRYHGWLYDGEGNVLETPGEPKGSSLKNRIKQAAYPVKELGGLLWAYFGPQPAPLLPRFDFLAAEGERYARITGIANCHWLQCSENGLDPFHVNFTHASTWTDLEPEPDLVDFETFDWGVRYKTWRPAERGTRYLYRDHCWLMPGISLGAGGSTRLLEGGTKNIMPGALQPKTVRFSVPVDQTHTLIIRVHWLPAESGLRYARQPLQTAEWQAIPVEPFKEQAHTDKPTLGYEWPSVIAAQDATLQDSIGPVSDRENENLSVIDGG